MANTAQPIRNREDIERIKNELESPRDRLLFTLGINTGLRISDLLALRVGDMRGQDHVTLKEKKTGKTKRLHLNDASKTAINALVPPTAKNDDWLFPSRKGTEPISRVQAFRILNDAAKRAGMKESVSCHSLRKTFGMFAYRNGADLAVLQSLFNHASQRVTLRYIGIEDDQVKDVYASVNL